MALFFEESDLVARRLHPGGDRDLSKEMLVHSWYEFAFLALSASASTVILELLECLIQKCGILFNKSSQV